MVRGETKDLKACMDWHWRLLVPELAGGSGMASALCRREDPVLKQVCSRTGDSRIRQFIVAIISAWLGVHVQGLYRDGQGHCSKVEKHEVNLDSQ